MNIKSRILTLIVLALLSAGTERYAVSADTPPVPKMQISGSWRKDTNGHFTLFLKLKNFEDYDVWINDASFDNQGWYLVGQRAPAVGILEFKLTADREPVVIYIKTVKHGVIRFDLDLTPPR